MAYIWVSVYRHSDDKFDRESHAAIILAQRENCFQYSVARRVIVS